MIEKVKEKYKRITRLLIENNITASTMESCTGGMIASLITDTEGASAVFKGALVTYCNEAKINFGVPSSVIEQYSVYSVETAECMAMSSRSNFGTVLGIGVTGTFGNPDPDNADSVPGKVCFAIACRNSMESFSLDIPEQKDRLSYKLLMANKIGNCILEMIENE